MSYKVDMTDIDREGTVSVTQQLADRFAAAIESNELAPGDKLPPTRALATEAGINHLTAARVYKRLAEDGFVTAAVGRGTFVRSPTPRRRWPTLSPSPTTVRSSRSPRAGPRPTCTPPRRSPRSRTRWSTRSASRPSPT